MSETTKNTEELNEKRRRKVKRRMYLKERCKHIQTELKEFPKRLPDHRLTILVAAVVLIMIRLYRKEIAKMVTSYWVDPVMKRFYNAPEYIYWLVVLIGGYYILACYKERKTSRTRIRLLSFITFAVGLAYMYNEKVEQLWHFASELTWIFGVAWFGEIALRIYHEYSNCKRYIKSSKQSLILDHPIKEPKEDQYKRSNYSRIVTEKINNNFHVKGAFVTGLSGSWGYGKTSFLNMMKGHIEELRKKDSKIPCKIDIQFDFEPWRSSSPDAIISDFMNQLAEMVEPYIPRIKRRLIKYADSISSLDSTPYLSNVFKVIRHTIDESPERQYERLSNDLRKAGLNILVFIDDTDRLAPDEIVEVFRLVRNSANFPYMQFVVTYDRDYIMKSLGESTHMITDPDTYMEKIFNVELALPAIEPFKKISLNYKVDEYLTISSEEKNNLRLSIARFWKYINFPTGKILVTQRDISRFINSYVINLEALAKSENYSNFTFQDINQIDFIKLELIRFKFPNFYNELMYNRENHLREDSNDEDSLVYKPLNSKTENNKKDTSTSHIIIDAKNTDSVLDKCMLDLFPHIPTCDDNSISKKRAFHQYFRYRFNDFLISSKESDALLLEKEREKQTEIISKFADKKNSGEIKIMFQNLMDDLQSQLRDEQDSDSLYSYISITQTMHAAIDTKRKDIIKEVAEASYPVFELRNYRNLKMYMQVLEVWKRLIGHNQALDTFIIHSLLLKRFLEESLGRTINEEDRVSIKKFLEESSKPEEISRVIGEILDDELEDTKLVLSNLELKQIQIKIFMNYSEGAKEIDNAIAELYRYCATGITSSSKDIFVDVNRRYKQLVENKPANYIAIWRDKIGLSVSLPRFWENIFDNDIAKMKEYFFSEKRNDVENIEDIRMVLTLYKYNENKPIPIGDGDFPKKDTTSLLENLTERLNTALDAKRELAKNREWEDNKLKELLDQINAIRFDLPIFNDVEREIERKINHL